MTLVSGCAGPPRRAGQFRFATQVPAVLVVAASAASVQVAAEISFGPYRVLDTAQSVSP